MTNNILHKFVVHHMSSWHPKQRFIMGTDAIGQWILQFPGRQRSELRIPVRIAMSRFELDDYLRNTAKLIDDFLVDEEPWQLWSAYV